MTTYGLTETGFLRPLLTEVRDDFSTAVKAAFGASIDTGDRSVIGQLLGIIAERLALLWEKLEQVNSSQDPDAATSAALDALSSLTGTFRPPASPSSVTLTLTGDPGTQVLAGNKASTASTKKQFSTFATANIAALSAWASTTLYALGDRVTNSSRAYQCTLSGTSGATGPTTTDTSIVDGTAQWDYLGEGAGATDVLAFSVNTGPIEAAARDITVQDTAVAGWSSVINVTGAIPGRDVATDAELRELRILELDGLGNSTPGAIRAALLRLANVIAVTIFTNTTDLTDADGMPPHSVEALVRGGLDQDITDTLFNNIAAGIATTGNQTGTAVDEEGVEHTIKWSRPEEKNIYLDITFVKDPATYAGDADVVQAITDWGAAQSTGKDVVASQVVGRVFSVDGVLDVTSVLLYDDVIQAPVAWAPTTAYVATPGARSVVTNDGGRAYICITAGVSAGSGGPTGTGTDITDGTAHWRYLGATYPIALRELAVYDSGRITLHTSDGTP